MKLSRFAARIHVYASSGMWVRVVHPAEAQRLIMAGAIPRKTKGGRTREIELTETLGRPAGPGSPPSPTQFMGQKYTYRERLKNGAGEIDSICHSHKWIDPRDRKIFVLSVTDCLVEAAA